jgi:hypothetical protein
VHFFFFFFLPLFLFPWCKSCTRIWESCLHTCKSPFCVFHIINT